MSDSDPKDLAQTIVELNAAREGDEDAANRLWERYYEKLIPAVRIRLGQKLRGKVETMDIVQNVFLEAVQSAENREFKSEGHFRAWINKLVENRIRKSARFFGQQKRDTNKERQLMDESGNIAAPSKTVAPRPVSIVEEFDQLERMDAALEHMPTDIREVITMRYFDELSYAEIGGLIDKSEEAARKTVNRAVALLAKEMGDE